jgi:Flp pilus assembly protein TadG
MATILHKVGYFFSHALQAAQAPFGGLWRDQQGAALIYVTVMLGAMFGFAALAIDFGRLATTHTQARAAAEAAALAAASQLDGTPDAITRATNAAQATPLVQNRQNLAQNPGNITISSLRFLSGLPAGTPSLPENRSVLNSYVTTDPLAARFVEVATQTLTQSNMFAQVIGGGQTSTANATAVAGFTQVVCSTVPLAICNPAESSDVGGSPGAPFNIADWKGRMVWAKQSSNSSGQTGTDAAWQPGDFGLVDASDGQGTPNIVRMLASTQPNFCIAATVDLKPGQVSNPVRNALNVRFDMYEHPLNLPNPQNDADFRPARNVTKGMIRTGGNCSTPELSPQAMALPRDTNIASSRFGNGIWDCPGYWSFNHPGINAPGGCMNPPTITRFDVYRYEIDNNLIPNNSATGGENGHPVCSSITPDDTPDRRVIVFAVINCAEQAAAGNPIRGNSAGPVPVEAFVKAFMTEPTGEPPYFNTYLEIVDVVKPGADDGILHDIVQLYR